jgi:hypothetical protein
MKTMLRNSAEREQNLVQELDELNEKVRYHPSGLLLPEGHRGLLIKNRFSPDTRAVRVAQW